jgi:hypothetical protein
MAKVVPTVKPRNRALENLKKCPLVDVWPISACADGRLCRRHVLAVAMACVLTAAAVPTVTIPALTPA